MEPYDINKEPRLDSPEKWAAKVLNFIYFDRLLAPQPSQEVEGDAENHQQQHPGSSSNPTPVDANYTEQRTNQYTDENDSTIVENGASILDENSVGKNHHGNDYNPSVTGTKRGNAELGSNHQQALQTSQPSQWNEGTSQHHQHSQEPILEVSDSTARQNRPFRYHCEICGMNYRYEGDFIKHMADAHNISMSDAERF